ncbi:hypothetical protein Tco_0316621 [Tanacetum coccineum]
MAEIGCNWARIGPSKSSQSLSIAHKWAVIPLTRFESAEHELETLRAQVVSINQEITALQARARAVEQRDKISQDMISKLEYKLEYAEYRIQ